MSKFGPLLLMLFSFLYADVSADELKMSNPEGIGAFSNLKLLHVENVGVMLYYDPKKSELLNVKLPDADVYEQSGISISRPLRTQLLGAGKGYFTIDCDSGPVDWNSGCTFFQEVGDQLKEITRIPGLQFAFPGNGNIYVEGHNNNMFSAKDKYEWRDGTFVVVRQPFKYVGLTTTTSATINIFSAQDYRQVVASLPKDSTITVLLNEGEHYLVKTPFGLLGWVRIPDGVSSEDSPITGIYFSGN